MFLCRLFIMKYSYNFWVECLQSNAASDQGLHGLNCLNYRKLKAEENSLKSLFMTIFAAYAQRQSTTSAVSALIRGFILGIF